MATKDKRLKVKHQSFGNNNSDISDNGNQYSNLNLNQSQKCLNFSSVQLNSKSNNDKFCDFGVFDNLEETGKSEIWNKFSKNSRVLLLKNDVKKEEAKKDWKKDSISNNSTLFLHINTYENSIEAVSDQFDDALTLVVQNSFEFPRQQTDKISEPEISQFRASKHLLNPNKASINDKIPLSAVHVVPLQRSSSDSLSTLRNQIGPIFGAIFLSSVLLQKKPMILPRLKPSTVLPLARSLTISNYRLASQGNPQLFKEINRLAREGKWDAINNAPEPLLRGHAKEEASAVYAKVIQPEDPFSKYGGQPYGPWVYLVTRVAGYFAGLFILCKAYELIVPEQYRLHYKYRPKKHHHDDDGHH